jgi:hypothetical protein
MRKRSTNNAPSDHRLESLTALARLIEYAKDNAEGLHGDFPSYSLDLARGAVAERMALEGKAFEKKERTGS